MVLYGESTGGIVMVVWWFYGSSKVIQTVAQW